MYLVGNARVDSVMYDLPPAQTGQRGRPAKRGKRLSIDNDFVFSDIKVNGYYISVRRVITNIFGDKPVVAYVTSPEKAPLNRTGSDYTTIDNAPAVTGLIFFRPTRGMISSEFDAAKKHYGIDIAASPNESVLATLDGTVMLATYTADTGYVIQVQHGQNLVSIYKHCGSLLKKVGDTVKAGEAIALVGNTGEKTTGPHLHFEIWNRGRALDPSKYIVF